MEAFSKKAGKRENFVETYIGTGKNQSIRLHISL
jgi:hypothetical protein